MSDGRGAGAAGGETRGRARKGQAKTQTQHSGSRQLPGTLTHDGLTLAINELPVGARLAADTVYQCWREGKFADDEFLSFLQSISTYSPALRQMVQGSGGLADMAVDRGSKVMPGIPIGGNMMAGAARRFAGGDKVMSAVPVEKTVSPESEAAMGINKEWRERRRREAIRRQSAGLEGSDHEKRVGFLCRTFMHLRQHLPLVALPALSDAVAGYTRRNRSPELFGQQMQDLVDAYQMVVPLDYIPQRHYVENGGGTDHGSKRGMGGGFAEGKSTGRGGKKSKLEVAPVAAVSLDDADLGRFVAASHGRGADMPMTSHTHQQQFAGEVCPACGESSEEDFRMVRCRVCRQSFHQMCVMYNPYLARDDDDGFECGSEGCPSFGRACRPPRYRLEDLTDTPLGQYMTARSRAAVKNPRDLVIKVVADKDLYKQLPDAAQGVGGTPGREGGFTTCGYRSKCILGFRTFPSSGSQVVFFGMYVHEYGAQSAAPHARRVFVECLDSTPLYSEERPCERQDLLTNIMLAYFEFVTAQGFEHVHIRVPPPTDDKAYIFASRSINIRLRATMHLALWFKRLLQVAKAQGVIDHFAASPNSGMNNTHNFPASLLEPAQLASDMAFRCATGDSRHDLGGGEDAKDLALKDRFFVVVLPRKAGGEGGRGLDPEMVQKWTQHAMLPSAIAGDRMALVSLLQREDLRFHSLAHNNYSTMMLVHHLMEEQQVLGSGRRSQHHHQQLQQRLGGSAGGAAYAHNVHHGPDPHGHAAHPYMAYGHGMMGDARMRGGRMHGGFAGGYMVGDMSLASQHQNPLHCGGEYSPRWTHGSRSGSQAGASPVGGNFGNWYPGAATGPGDFGAGGRSRSTSSATLNRLPECKDGESPCMQSDGAAVGKDDWHRVDGAAQRSASARHGKAQGRAGGRQGAGHSKRGRDGGEREGSATSSDHTRGTGTSESTSNHSGTPTEQTDEHSDEMLDAMAEEDCQDHDISHEKHQLPMLMEQGEGLGGNFIDQCGANAASLEDVRHAQAQAGLSAEEQNVWTSQTSDWASLDNF